MSRHQPIYLSSEKPPPAWPTKNCKGCMNCNSPFGFLSMKFNCANCGLILPLPSLASSIAPFFSSNHGYYQINQLWLGLGRQARCFVRNVLYIKPPSHTLAMPSLFVSAAVALLASVVSKSVPILFIYDLVWEHVQKSSLLASKGHCAIFCQFSFSGHILLASSFL